MNMLRTWNTQTSTAFRAEEEESSETVHNKEDVVLWKDGDGKEEGSVFRSAATSAATLQA